MFRFFSIVSLFFLLTSIAYADNIKPVKIGVSLGLTGKYAEMSDMTMKGLKLWQTDVNKKGGILGRKVNLIIYDDKSDSETAKSIYENLITKDNIDLVIAPYSSQLTEAILPIIEKYKYPTVTTSASDKLWENSNGYLFGIITPASRYAVGFLEMLVLHNFKDVAIIYADDAFSKSIANGTKEWAEKFGLQALLFSEFKKGRKDFTEILTKARSSNASALIVCGHFDEAVNVRLSLKKIRWYPKAYYASIGPALPAFHQKLGSEVNYVFSSANWEYNAKLPGSKKFYADFIKAYGKEPAYQAVEGYSAGTVLEKAINKAGTLEKVKLRDILFTMDTLTIIGRYNVDKTGKQIKHFPLIIQWQKGKKEIVWPEDLSTAKPLFGK